MRAPPGRLRGRYPALPFALAGFSFGARAAISLAASLEDDGPGRVIAAGFPTIDAAQPSDAVRCRRPRVFIQSTHDQYGPRPQFEAFYERLWGPKQLLWIDARDHFFLGALDEFEHAVTTLGSLSRA